MRELETILKNIRTAVKAAINTTTGEVDGPALDLQATAVKGWASEFEINYVSRAAQKKIKRAQIETEGHKIRDHALFCKDTLLDAAMFATQPPAPTKFGVLSSGEVPGESKAQVDEELSNLLDEFIQFRRTVLEE